MCDNDVNDPTQDGVCKAPGDIEPTDIFSVESQPKSKTAGSYPTAPEVPQKPAPPGHPDLVGVYPTAPAQVEALDIPQTEGTGADSE